MGTDTLIGKFTLDNHTREEKQEEGSCLKHTVIYHRITVRGWGWRPMAIPEEVNSTHVFRTWFINLFHQQRNAASGEHQFAVLFLSSDINHTTLFQTRDGMVGFPAAATINATPTYPPAKKFCNYVTARSEGPNHAEKLLMNRFSTLLMSYTSLGMPECISIVLYTWLLPCLYCKRESKHFNHMRTNATLFWCIQQRWKMLVKNKPKELKKIWKRLG